MSCSSIKGITSRTLYVAGLMLAPHLSLKLPWVQGGIANGEGDLFDNRPVGPQSQSSSNSMPVLRRVFPFICWIVILARLLGNNGFCVSPLLLLLFQVRANYKGAEEEQSGAEIVKLHTHRCLHNYLFLRRNWSDAFLFLSACFWLPFACPWGTNSIDIWSWINLLLTLNTHFTSTMSLLQNAREVKWMG